MLNGMVWPFVVLFISVPISFHVAFELFLHKLKCLQKYAFLLMFLSLFTLFEYCLNSHIFIGSLDRKWRLYIACFLLIDLSIPLDIQGFLKSFCCFLDTCYLGACLSTINLSASIVWAVTSCKSLH